VWSAIAQRKNERTAFGLFVLSERASHSRVLRRSAMTSVWRRRFFSLTWSIGRTQVMPPFVRKWIFSIVSWTISPSGF